MRACTSTISLSTRALCALAEREAITGGPGEPTGWYKCDAPPADGIQCPIGSSGVKCSALAQVHLCVLLVFVRS